MLPAQTIRVKRNLQSAATGAAIYPEGIVIFQPALRGTSYAGLVRKSHQP